MPLWECPSCHRRFGRVRQSHECAPAMTLDEYFSTGPPFERPVFDAVMAHLDTVGPVHVEPVSVGIFIKRGASMFELRPMTKWVALSFRLPRRVEHSKITRHAEWNGSHYHFVRLREASDVDDDVKGWLTEAYLATPE